MSYHPIPVENTPLDRAQVARVLVTAHHAHPYYPAAYSFNPLPVLIENARLRLGSNLLNPKGWFMKIVAKEVEDGDSDGDAGSAHTHKSETFGNGELKSGVLDKQHEKGVEKSDGNGEIIVSYAKWGVPLDLKEKLEKEYPRAKLSETELAELDADRRKGCDANGEPKGMNEELIEEVGAQMEKARQAFPSHRPHMSLDLLATLPSCQRRGLATAHVKWGLKLADREGLLVFLESTPSGADLYKKLGFKEVSSATHDLTKWGGDGSFTHLFMVREPEKVQREAEAMVQG
ncbi:unnamed protein product [Calypogeia fissa]